jgi:ATP-dependent Clp protease ATP-binding subunit ClpC
MNFPLERFNSAARDIAALSMSDALRLNHPAVGTEHILAAIMGHAHNEAAFSLLSLGITRAETLHALLSLEIPCKILKPPLPLAPIAQKMLWLAITESNECQSAHVGPEHFLLAMTRLPECAGIKMLEQMGLTAEQVRACMKGRMGL